MNKIKLLLATLVAALFMSGCGAAKVTPAQQSLVDNKTPLYTQVSMWIDSNRIYGTNFGKGLLVPVNSQVKITSISGKAIAMEYLGAKVTYYVTTKHTSLDTSKTMDRLFSTKKVDLSKFSAKAKENIMNGNLVVGMSKSEVLIARGYPPSHQTLSTESNLWKYWYHRFKTSTVSFKDGKVSKLEGGVF